MRKSIVAGVAVLSTLALAVPAAQAADAIVFVTSGKYAGNFGGVAVADNICNQLAANAGLPGVYKAWLSDNVSSPSTTFMQNADPYVLSDGVTMVAADWADLTDGSLLHAIDMDENGVVVADTERVWTGTKSNALAVTANRCDEWTNTAAKGWQGRPTETAGNWTTAGTVSCRNHNRLYCFEQNPQGPGPPTGPTGPTGPPGPSGCSGKIGPIIVNECTDTVPAFTTLILPCPCPPMMMSISGSFKVPPGLVGVLDVIEFGRTADGLGWNAVFENTDAMDHDVTTDVVCIPD